MKEIKKKSKAEEIYNHKSINKYVDITLSFLSIIASLEGKEIKIADRFCNGISKLINKFEMEMNEHERKKSS